MCGVAECERCWPELHRLMYIFFCCLFWIPHRLLFCLALTLGSSSTCFCSVRALNPSHCCLSPLTSSSLNLYSVLLADGSWGNMSSFQPTTLFSLLQVHHSSSPSSIQLLTSSTCPSPGGVVGQPSIFSGQSLRPLLHLLHPVLFTPLIRRPPHLSFLLLLSNFLCSNEMLYTEGSVYVPYQQPLASGIRWREIGLK